MRFNIFALSLAVGIFWSVAIFIVALANMIWPGYGNAFLDLLASIYPGYQHNPGIGSIVTATLYGLVDGLIGGAIFAWLYNLLASKCQSGKG
jgi:hypothetical protein